jgi:outer membrane protein assembly factor BamB
MKKRGRGMIGHAPKRSVVFAAVVAALLALGVGASSALASPGDESTAYQTDVAHNGYIADAGLATPLTQAWSIALPGSASYPLIVDGMVFVTAADQKVYALNQATGSTVWSHSIGGTYSWSGLTYDRGQLFVLNNSGLLTAFNPATGAIAWNLQLPGQYLFSSSPTAANGIVYAGGAGDGGTVYAVRESTGQLLWTGSVENGDQSSPAVDANGVYVSYACQQAYDFGPLSGTMLWHHDSACEGGGGKTPVLADGHVFVRDNVLGNVMLSASTGAVESAFSAGPAPAVANGVAFMLDNTGLTAIAGDGLGNNNWTFAGDGHLDTAPLVVGGLVFVGSSGDNLYALDAAAGTTSWSTNVGMSIPGPDEQNVSQPLTGLGAANGTLVLSAGSQLMAYRTAGAITTAPVNQTPPTIDGPGQTAHFDAADVGIWSELPSTYTYQWELCDGAGANCADIGGASNLSFTPPVADVGSTLRVKVTATNGVGSSTAVESAATAPIVEAPPENLTLPTVSGTDEQGQMLTATHGTWTGVPTGYSFQWLRCPGYPSPCTPIGGAIGSTYTLAAADVGNEVEVQVIASNAGGASAPADSLPTSTVMPAPGATTTSLSPAQQSILAGDQATLTAQVTGTQVGTVDLYGTPSGGAKTLVTSGALAGGSASFAVSPSVNTTYSATLEAGPGYLSSTSQNVTVSIVPRSMPIAASKHTVTYGGKVDVKVTGVTTSGKVDLFGSVNGETPTLVKTATVGAGQHNATFKIAPRRKTAYFAEREDKAAASNDLTVSVRPLLVIAVHAKKTSAAQIRRRGEKVLIAAGRAPALPGEPLKLEVDRARPHGGWQRVAQAEIPVGGSGIIVAVFVSKVPGSFRVMASYRSDGNYVSAHSHWRRFKVG